MGWQFHESIFLVHFQSQDNICEVTVSFVFLGEREGSCKVWRSHWVTCNSKWYLEDHPRTCKWLVTPIYNPFRPFGNGMTVLRGFTKHSY